MKAYVRTDGYRMYILRDGNRSHHRKAHQLVARAFIGPKPDDGRWEVCHADGTRTNDHWTNLRWGTSADNKADMVHHRTRMHGETHANSKLSAADVAAIRRRVASGEVQRRIGEEYGIGQAQVSRLANGKQWASADV
jgi:hypothetical protein